MPFTVEQFFEVFRRYNEAVWPAQVVAVVDAFIAAGAALRGGRRANKLIAIVLAALWFWMGAVYHLQFFRQVNPAAVIFGVTFLIQAALFIWLGVAHDRLTFDPRLDVAAVQLGVGEDFGLAVSALLSLPLLLRQGRQLQPRPA